MCESEKGRTFREIDMETEFSVNRKNGSSARLLAEGEGEKILETDRNFNTILIGEI